MVRRRRGGRRSGEEADPVDTRSNPNADSAAPTFLAKGEGVEDPCSKQVATLVTQRLGAIQNEAADRIFVFPEARLKRWALAAAISFADLVTATTAMLSGMVALQIAEHIANSLEVDETLVRVVIGATSQQKSDEARRLRIEREEAYSGSFRPHLQVQTERRVPSQIFVVALLTVARLRIIRLPDEAITADGEARDRIVKAIILDHRRETGGHVPAFGAITGYLLVLVAGCAASDFGLPYNVSGDPVGGMQKVQRLYEATLGTKRGDTRLAGLLKMRQSG